MIELMVQEAKKYFPLAITSITWDETVLNMYGPNWSFTTLSAWRVSMEDRIIFGCFDRDSIELTKELTGREITDIYIQADKLKVDPVFLLSNGQMLEIFSTDTYEPWTFKINKLGLFVATPGEPNAFDALE